MTVKWSTHELHAWAAAKDEWEWYERAGTAVSNHGNHSVCHACQSVHNTHRHCCKHRNVCLINDKHFKKVHHPFSTFEIIWFNSATKSLFLFSFKYPFLISFCRATMAENQEMSPMEIKVARQIEVMIMSFFSHLDLGLINNTLHLTCSITSVITTFQGTSSSKNSCSLMMAGCLLRLCSNLTGIFICRQHPLLFIFFCFYN